MQSHVDNGHSLDYVQANAEITQRAKDGGDSFPTNADDFFRGERGASNLDSSSRRDPNAFRNCHFNRFARSNVESMQPGGRKTREDRRGRQTNAGRLDPEFRSVR